jgi:hypothetical protein
MLFESEPARPIRTPGASDDSAMLTENRSMPKAHWSIGASVFATTLRPVLPLNTTAQSSPMASFGRPAGLKIVYRIQNACRLRRMIGA